MIVVGVILGALTHLIWDSFTHDNNLTENFLPFLNSTIFEIRGQSVKLYKLLQHGSTLGGFALLTVWYCRWFSEAPARTFDAKLSLSAKKKTGLLLAMLGTALGLGIIYGAWSAGGFSGVQALKIFLGRSVVAAGAVLAMVLLVYCIIWNRKRPHVVQEKS